ncbi:MAG: RagB/SusD family nutrient uptake outer membrane protein [Prevotella sp.]|nr:RagB/SusD family nutrient uptake outer membrane protein [Prevotella sp.]
MKYNKIIIGLLVGAFTLTGCSDFLDQTPATSKNTQEVYRSLEEIQGRMNAMYGNLCGNMYGTWIPILFGTNSDVELIDGIGTTATDTGERGTFNYFTTRADQWDTNGKLYAALYQEVGECNDIIAGIQNSPLFADDNEKVKQNLGEALVIRAQMYMELTRIWGDVPLQLSIADGNLDNVYVGKTDRDYILDKMLEDLEKAEGYLQNCTNPSTKVTKAYAQALYVQIALQRCGYAIRETLRNAPYEATTTYEDEVDGQKFPYENAANESDARKKISDPNFPTLRAPKEKRVELYTKAIAKAYDVIKNSGKTLVPSFDDYWTEVNLRHDNISENIFEIPTTQGETSELGYTIGVRMNWDEQQPTANYGMRNASGKVKVVAPLAYSYEETDTRRNVTCSMAELVDSLQEYEDENGNVRSVHIAREKHIGDAPFGIYVGKWDCRKLFEKDPSWLAQNKSSEGKTLYGIHPVRMRLPQVLLYYAELYNELKHDGGVIPAECTMTAEDAINAVHRRATGQDATIASSSYEDVFKAIDNENKWEFAGEGFRKWDLIRWNLLVHHTLQMKLDYLNGLKSVYNNSMAANIRYYPENEVRYMQATMYYDWDWIDGSNGKVTWDASFGSTGDAFEKNKTNWASNYEKGKKEAQEKGITDPDEIDAYAKKYQVDHWSVMKQADTNLPTISNGLVGFVPGSEPSENALTERINELKTIMSDLQTNVKPNGTTVLNRYIMPLTTNIMNNSNQNLKNSYGF